MIELNSIMFRCRTSLGDLVPLDRLSPKQNIARQGMMLRVLVGSGVHGTSIVGSDDIDEMGVCVEPPESVIGSRKFEHYIYRTQPEGVCSGPGDLDLVVYGLRKFVCLVMQGNPTVLLPLFVNEEHVRWSNEFGTELRANRELFLSRQCGARFMGYLQSQRQGMMGLRSGGTRNQGRADIREKYGFDTKFAGHMVRLGLQGVELLSTGSISLPIPEPHRTWIRDLREGKHPKEEALEWAEDLEEQLRTLLAGDGSPLPARPDQEAVDRWVLSVHRRFWGW